MRCGMKKIIVGLLITLFAISAYAGEKLKASDIFNVEAMKKGYSAKIVTTTIMGGIKNVSVSKQYIADENMRIENEEEKTGQIIREEGTYFINHTKKSYFFMPESGMFEGGEVENDKEEQGVMPDVNDIYESAGKEKFAGVMCNKYKMISTEEMAGDVYIYIDPAKKMCVGSSIKSQGFESKSEWYDVKFGLDKSVFELPKGYKKSQIME